MARESQEQLARFDSFERLGKAVEDAGGVLTTTMENLRDAYGVKRLGIHVVADISRKLGSLGLEHLPIELPINQWEHVRIFRRNSKVAEVIHAVLHPSAANDERLRRAAGGGNDDALRILSEVRDLVGSLPNGS